MNVHLGAVVLGVFSGMMLEDKVQNKRTGYKPKQNRIVSIALEVLANLQEKTKSVFILLCFQPYHEEGLPYVAQHNVSVSSEMQ